MPKLLSKCPVCRGELKISALHCPDCGLELKNTFEFNAFDRLDDDQYNFLNEFLRQRGNLKNVQDVFNISYPTAKKKLDDLLLALGLSEAEENDSEKQEVINLENLHVDTNSTKASEIIKAKLRENGGRVVVHTARGLPCEVWAAPDGVSFISDKLPIKPPFRFEVFDMIVDLLTASNGRARKGNGRNYRVGQPDCDETTVVGYIAKNYFGKKDGESTFDPVFVFSAILEWAGIATNGRGKLILKASYK
jgi:hypothetical protein